MDNNASELPVNNITKKKKKQAKETTQQDDSLMGGMNDVSSMNNVNVSSSTAPPTSSNNNNNNRINLEITVSDPQKQGEGIGSFVSYKIRTRVLSNSTGGSIQFDYDDFTVIRRYSDFAWYVCVLK